MSKYCDGSGMIIGHLGHEIAPCDLKSCDDCKKERDDSMTQITKEQLDTRICDVVETSTNTETYRKFIKNTEEEFGIQEKDLDLMNDNELNSYLEFLDYLWDK